MNHLQLKLIDLFWLTGLVACVVGAVTSASPEIALIGLCCVLLFVWNRPVLLRFWTLAVVGIGVGVFVIGFEDADAFGRMRRADSEAWGAAMAIGGILAFILFDVRKPPARECRTTIKSFPLGSIAPGGYQASAVVDRNASTRDHGGIADLFSVKARPTMVLCANSRNVVVNHCSIAAGMLLSRVSARWTPTRSCLGQEPTEERCKIINFEHPGTVETRGKFRAGEKPTAFIEFTAPLGTKYPIVLSFVVAERRGDDLVRYAEGTGIVPLRGKEKSHEIECKDIILHPKLAGKKGFVFVLFINGKEYPGVEYKIPSL